MFRQIVIYGNSGRRSSATSTLLPEGRDQLHLIRRFKQTDSSLASEIALILRINAIAPKVTQTSIAEA
jgi:hypothetical protein